MPDNVIISQIARDALVRSDAELDVSQQARVAIVQQTDGEIDVSQIARVTIYLTRSQFIDYSQIARVTVVRGFSAGSSAACRGYVVV